MKHVSNGVEWHGFQRISRPIDAPIDAIMIVAWFDGVEPELWAAESLDGVESLRRYYRYGWSDRDIPFTLARVRAEHSAWAPMVTA